VRKELRLRLLAAIEDSLRSAGGKSFEHGMQFSAKLFHALGDTIGLADTRKKADAMLKKMPDPSAGEEELAVEIASKLPLIVSELLKSYSAGIGAEFGPADDKPKGRPRALTIKQEQQVCEFVAKLYAQGLQLRHAKARAAQHFGVSKATIARVWSGRGLRRGVTVRDLIDVLKG
jgi:hypothetical protein